MDNSNSVEEKNDDLERVLSRDKLTLEDVRVVLRIVRHHERDAEMISYANTLLQGAGDYLPPYTLRALVRADIDEDEAARYLERNRAFFSRLTELLPSLIGFFLNRRNNLIGILSCIDDCHNDFHAATTSPRKDRQLRETRELITNTLETAVKAVAALEKASQYFTTEYSRYREIYYPVERPRHLDELIDELRVCSGVLEIVSAAVDLNPKRLILSGNDQRKSLVEWAYHMCTMWDGPKLVTTPGSQFAALCSLLFEAMSGEADEGLAGAINRYARSDERKEWDEQGEEAQADDDNFISQKNAMRFSEREIELCKALLKKAGFSTTAETLLLMRINSERQNHGEASNKYGPHQVYMSQLSPEQIDAMLGEAIGRLSPEKLEELGTRVGKSSAALDISLGEARRSARRRGLDA